MKKNLLFCFALICSIGIFSSCSDDDEEKFIFGSVPVSFSSQKLNLTYSGADMPGKKVTFSTTDGKVGQFVMEGSLDLKAIMGKTKDLAGLGNIAPGVFPGEKKTTINNVNLTLTNNQYTFSGVDSQNGRTFAYEGTIDTAKMVLKIKDVVYPDHKLSGKWNVVKFGRKTPAIHGVWESSSKIGGIFDGKALLMVLLESGFFGGNNMQQMLNAVLRDVDFCKDGNIIASYSNKDMVKNPNYQPSPKNIAQYIVDDEKSLRLFLNPDMIIASVKTKAVDYQLPPAVIDNMVSNLLPLLSGGFPLKYTIVENKACVYADKILLDKVFSVLIPLIEDPKFIAMIMDKIKESPLGNDPQMGALLPFIEGMLKDVPAFLKGTTKIELGINLEK